MRLKNNGGTEAPISATVRSRGAVWCAVRWALLAEAKPLASGIGSINWRGAVYSSELGSGKQNLSALYLHAASDAAGASGAAACDATPRARATRRQETPLDC
jgi:hypothetical protein